MLNAIKKKDKFIEEVERKFASLMDAYRNLNESVKSHYGITEIDDVNTKFQTLKKALNALGWKITNFKNNQLDLDSTVQNSFVELIDEIEWRTKEIEMALQGSRNVA